MKRWMGALLAVLLLLGSCGTALADTKLKTYALLANGEKIPLDADSGYLARSGNRLMIPVAAVCEAMSLNYKENSRHTRVDVELPDGSTLVAMKGYRYVKVNGKKKALRAKSYVQSGKHLMVDVGVLSYMEIPYKHYKKSADTREAGFPSGVLMMGSELTLPQSEAVPQPEQSAVANLPAAQKATQIVLVEHKGGCKAVVSLHEKDENGLWKQTFSTNGYVGRNGIDKTREGDGRTPTGTFNLTQAFGIKAQPEGTALDYVKVTKYHYWCGTSGSKCYNQLIDTRKLDYTPTRADEHLIDYGSAYYYGIFIDYNVGGVAGKGSCIFLHCSTGKGTAGCVSVPQSAMVQLLKALKPGAKIVIG